VQQSGARQPVQFSKVKPGMPTKTPHLCNHQRFVQLFSWKLQMLLRFIFVKRSLLIDHGFAIGWLKLLREENEAKRLKTSIVHQTHSIWAKRIAQ